ncbi:hypothetical protein [Salimicrobium flavidum]|uniref:Uncharacterized protein n=1 Tax=Salimicrobium flavidum TaxID=570947 RepID=A0A1N7J938_9BACI|nr:hypothetical protein [Salimicrobium flavidum]SIS45771.1 hypothetical protein SAMN05421687_104166 [Salimicrobium flavidum]
MVEFAFLLIILLFVLQGVVLVYLLTAKKQRLDSEEEKERYYQNWFPSFYAYLLSNSGTKPEVDAPARIYVPVIEGILNHLIDHEYESIDKKRLQAVTHFYLVPSYRLYLKHGSWSQRVNTLYFIEEFSIIELKNDVWIHFHHLTASDEEYRQALRTLASFHDERLIPILLQSHQLSQRMIKELLRKIPISVIRQLMDAMENNKERLPHQLQL